MPKSHPSDNRKSQVGIGFGPFGRVLSLYKKHSFTLRCVGELGIQRREIVRLRRGWRTHGPVDSRVEKLQSDVPGLSVPDLFGGTVGGRERMKVVAGKKPTWCAGAA